MKLKELQSLMQDIRPFTRPILDLEQYPTGIELAARVLFTIDSVYGDFNGRTVADLGCGTGRLAIGAALLGSPHVIGIDVDAEALDTCRDNIEQFEDIPVDLLQCNVQCLEQQDRLSADTVVMNPPFGTRRKGADIDFLRAGLKVRLPAKSPPRKLSESHSCLLFPFQASLQAAEYGDMIARRSIYSLHKTSTRQHIQRLAEKEIGRTSSQVIAQLRYDLPASYSFHKQKTKDIEVDLWRFDVTAKC